MKTSTDHDRDHLYHALDLVLEHARARDPERARRLVQSIGRRPNRQGLGIVLAMLVGRDRTLHDRVAPAIESFLDQGALGVRDVAAGLFARWADLTGEWPRWVEREDNREGEYDDDKLEVLP